jgi:hypothetical protein
MTSTEFPAGAVTLALRAQLAPGQLGQALELLPRQLRTVLQHPVPKPARSQAPQVAAYRHSAPMSSAKRPQIQPAGTTPPTGRERHVGLGEHRDHLPRRRGHSTTFSVRPTGSGG